MNSFEKPKSIVSETSETETDWRAYTKLEKMAFENTQIAFLAVRHTKESIDLHREQIEEYIKSSEILVSELAVFDENSDSDINIFYREITEIAQENKKTMVIPDPEKNISDALLNRATDVVPLISTATATGYLGVKIKNILDEIQSTKNTQIQTEPKLTRRNFLKFAAATTVVGLGSMSSVAGLFEEARVDMDPDGTLQKFLLSSLDYRNACVAREVQSLSKTHEKISIIYGAAHRMGIQKFLENPDLLEEKISVYEKTYGILNPAKTDVYDFSEPEREDMSTEPAET